MECLHCKAWNEEDERRCVRCGRRLQPASPRPAPDTYPVMGAAAPALELLQNPQQRQTPASIPQNGGGAAAPAMRIVPDQPPTQGQQALPFRDESARPRLVPIPMLTPVRSQTGPRKATLNAPRNAAARRAADIFSQQSLDLGSADANGLGLQVEAVIFCDAPVALPVHRLMAAAYDASMIAIAVGMFTAIFYLSGGRIEINKQTILLAAGVIFTISMFYRALWCLGDGDSPGMRFAGLKLVNFDGRVPERNQRGVRLAAYVISALSAGLGLIWGLVDEESLTWHDHISKTFPTPV